MLRSCAVVVGFRLGLSRDEFLNCSLLHATLFCHLFFTIDGVSRTRTRDYTCYPGLFIAIMSCINLLSFTHFFIYLHPLLAAANGYFRFLYVTKFDGKENCILGEMFKVAAGS